MNAQLNYMMVQHRSAELRRAGERARLATEVPARRRRLRDQRTANGATEPTAGICDSPRTVGNCSTVPTRSPQAA